MLTPKGAHLATPFQITALWVPPKKEQNFKRTKAKLSFFYFKEMSSSSSNILGSRL
jgi:hypothetical protein